MNEFIAITCDRAGPGRRSPPRSGNSLPEQQRHAAIRHLFDGLVTGQPGAAWRERDG